MLRAPSARVIVACVLFAADPSAAWALAQATTATLHGVVTSDGGPIPAGARVEVRNEETGDSRDLFNWANHADYLGDRTLQNYGEPVGDFARRQAQLGVRYRF